jgi:hypothetical protein
VLPGIGKKKSNAANTMPTMDDNPPATAMTQSVV